MFKPFLIADVRSILRRSLPEFGSLQSSDLDFTVPEEFGNQIPLPGSPEFAVSDRAHQVMQTLEAATEVARLFPGARLVLLTIPKSTRPPGSGMAQPLPFPVIKTRELRRESSADLAAIVRTAMVEDLSEDLPPAAESLLAELGVIERQNRSYFLADSRTGDATAAFNYRQRRRSDILAELLELKRSASGPLDPAS